VQINSEEEEKSHEYLGDSNPRIRLFALKKAENSDEIILRLVELDGKPLRDARISFAAPVSAAREVNGQEQPVGPANIVDGNLVTSFTAYQPRTFAIKLGSASAKAATMHSEPVKLDYELATASNHGTHATEGFDGHGNSLPAEMLPSELTFDDVKFQLAPAKTGVPNAVISRGQSLSLPPGQFNRLYIIAASADGDQPASFELGGKTVELNIQDWGGFIGQWDDRKWSKSGADDDYGEMTGLKPRFIKRADLAWFDSNHRNAAGEDVPYGYSYLFAYAIDLPAGTRTVKLPDNNKIRVLAMSVAQENAEVWPAQPLYDALPQSETAMKSSISVNKSGKRHNGS
jgi:alpha-mannosidase